MAIWQRTPELAQLTAQLADTIGEVLDIRFEAFDEDSLTASMVVDRRTHQPYGLLHGGASCVLAETLGSIGSALLAGPGRIAVGIEINATHHRSATSGHVTGVAVPVHAGRTLATWDIEITDDTGRRVCTSRLTCMLRDAPGR